MIGLTRLKRAIADVPTGGMQTGDPKVPLKLCDAQRLEVEFNALIAERDNAWQELREIREAIGANPEESTADEVRRVNAHSAELVNILTKERDFLLAKLDENEAQKVQIAELVAQLKLVKNIFRDESLSPAETLRKIPFVIDLTPTQCLRDIQAEAAEKYYYMGWEHSLSTKADDGDHYGCGKRLAKEFAASVKAGEV